MTRLLKEGNESLKLVRYSLSVTVGICALYISAFAQTPHSSVSISTAAPGASDTNIGLSWVAPPAITSSSHTYPASPYANSGNWVQFKQSTSSTWITWGVGGINGNAFPIQTSAAGITGLTPGATYNLRLLSFYGYCEAECDFISYLSNNILTIRTKPSDPVVTISNITNSSFKIRWTSFATGSDNHRIEVARDEEFAVVVADHTIGRLSGQLEKVIDGLDGGTTYYYRVSSSHSESTSAGYASGLVTIIPSTPLQPNISEIGPQNLKVSWGAVVGAATYDLELATDSDFTSIVDRKEDLAETHAYITGLVVGTRYYARVLASNVSGQSDFSPTNSAFTLPAVPQITGHSGKTSSSFNISWSAVQSASNYKLEVSSDEQFTQLVTDYNPKVVTAPTTNLTISGLSSGTRYFSRIRAVNSSGESANSVSENVVTICGTPYGLATTDVTLSAVLPVTKSFRANWVAPTGAVTYRLDVSTNIDFTANLPAFNNLVIGNVLQYTVTGLMPGVTYYYRVRAANSQDDVSENSDAMEVLGVPQNVLITSLQTGTGLSVRWDEVSGATQYVYELSTSEDFFQLLPGYPKTTGLSSLDITPLNAGDYFLRVKAKNEKGTSIFSKPVGKSLSSSGDGSIKIDSPILPESFDASQSQTIQLRTKGKGLGTVTVKLFHRKSTAANGYEINIMSQTRTDLFEIDINKGWVDELGMQLYFLVEDEFGNSDSSEDSPATLVVKKISKIPVQRIGSGVKNYQIISLPDNVGARDIETLLGGVLGAYDDSEWRLFQFDNSRQRYIEYEEGLKRKALERGRGYWFITRTDRNLDADRSLNFGASTTYPDNIDNPFVLKLDEGWNLIGNPFPFDISWNDLLVSNTGAKVRSDLWEFDPSTGLYKKAGILKANSGGFVFAESQSDLRFKTSLAGVSGGRVAAYDSILEEGEWVVPISIRQNNKIMTTSGIGMKFTAKEGIDKSDVIVPPRFISYLEFASRPKMEKYSLSQSIVPVSNNYIWEFELDYNNGSPPALSWDLWDVKASEGELLLHDLTNHTLIKMNEVTEYNVRSRLTHFKIYYNANSEVEESVVQFGNPHPNPFKSSVSFPIDYNPELTSRSATLVIFDMQGRRVVSLSKENLQDSGVLDFNWNGMSQNGESLPAGIYSYKLISTNSEMTYCFHGILIKE